MKNLKIISLGIAMLITFLSFGQERTITGTVSDETGPLPGANIVIKGTTRTTQTDFDGKYSIKASTGEILIFSFTGYKNKTITIQDSTTIKMTLEEDTRLKEEPPCYYPIFRKKPAEHTVIKKEEIEKVPIAKKKK